MLMLAPALMPLRLRHADARLAPPFPCHDFFFFFTPRLAILPRERCDFDATSPLSR